jgi:hypothetical protein
MLRCISAPAFSVQTNLVAHKVDPVTMLGGTGSIASEALYPMERLTRSACYLSSGFLEGMLPLVRSIVFIVKSKPSSKGVV